MQSFEDVVQSVATRDKARSEATLAADIRTLLLAAGLELGEGDLVGADLESPVGDGTRRRIDIEAGTSVIEVKRDLTVGTVLSDAVDQLGGYLRTRANQTGRRYQGVLTDGRHWYLYVPDPGGDQSASALPAGAPFVLDGAAQAEDLRYWLATVLSTQSKVVPTKEAITRRLGASSPAHAADHMTLAALYREHASDPNVVLKRDLWGKLLRTAFGAAFRDEDALFIDHTLLVLTAEAIAHAVLGFDISRTGNVTPRQLASGELFDQSDVHGVVEADFFDWVLDVPSGEQFVRTLADRLARFDWKLVEHDAMKHLYEATISAATRKTLGEYYTPDWLADQMVKEHFSEPLKTRAMDVSCGSGTFLFHATRAYLRAAEDDGQSNAQALAGLTVNVVGVDIHPVAVTLARVTYLLAIGTDRLTSSRGSLWIPVYLGDSMQWEQRQDLLVSEDTVTIATSGDDIIGAGGGALFGDELVFPAALVANADAFDRFVDDMASAVVSLTGPGFKDSRRFRTASSAAQKAALDPVLSRHQVSEEHHDVLRVTFDTWHRLNHSGRNHVWGYYVRNLIRPLWLSRPENRADLLIGNPPWLSYSQMHTKMQQRYEQRSREYGLLAGRLGVSGRDLSTLFVARACDLYLASEGRFAYVMPHGVLTRKPHHRFRTGVWSGGRGSYGLGARFNEAWDLLGCATGFPITSCVVSGQRTSATPTSLPSTTDKWTTTFPDASLTWDQAVARTQRSPGSVIQHDPDDPTPRSPYAKSFRQGALILPRRLVCVTREDAGPLGMAESRVRVTSRRSPHDKDPWRVANLQETVDEAYLYPVLMGENALPYRITQPTECVLPVENRVLLSNVQISARPHLNSWWEKAEQFWSEHAKEGTTTTLAERLDYHQQLSSQLEDEHRYRVVYPKAGNRIAAAIVRDSRAIIDHKLYWTAVSTEEEAYYLCAILNSCAILERVKPLQTQGLFGARDIDKYVFHIPFPNFDPRNPHHLALASAARKAEAIAYAVDVSEATTFQRARALIADALMQAGLSEVLEAAAEHVLPHVDPEAVEEG